MQCLLQCYQQRSKERRYQTIRKYTRPHVHSPHLTNHVCAHCLHARLTRAQPTSACLQTEQNAICDVDTSCVSCSSKYMCTTLPALYVCKCLDNSVCLCKTYVQSVQLLPPFDVCLEHLNHVQHRQHTASCTHMYLTLSAIPLSTKSGGGSTKCEEKRFQRLEEAGR